MADMTAGDVMVAAPRMDVINIDAPFDELLHLVIDTAHSRFPVYESEKEKLKSINDNKEDNKEDNKIYKNFEKIHTGEILNSLGLKRYCCRRNLITNIDMMDVI